MHAHPLERNLDVEDSETEESDRDSHTRIVTRDHANPPWGGRRATPLERAFAEIVLFEGANCVIRELDPSSEEQQDGGFEAMAISVDMQGELVDVRRARYAALERGAASATMRRRRTR